jgi:hypothetical protein
LFGHGRYLALSQIFFAEYCLTSYVPPRQLSLMILEREEVTAMDFLFFWLVQLTDGFLRLIFRLGQLEVEVRALQQQRPHD